MNHRTVSLSDKYTLQHGRIFITGVQALVRLPLTQHQRDMARGLNTAGYVSGYRGSPLGTYDAELGKAKKFLDAANVQFVPGVNEDLAATAVWGTQQAEIGGEGKFDGVFSIWYGKGPGVDRTGDAFRHANLAGTSKHGGVLVLMGDDHTCESSTTCHQSEFALIDAAIPILSPAGVQEILDLGLYGWEMSRFSGCWVGMKCVKDTADATASVDVDPQRLTIQVPEDFALPADGLNIRQPDTPHAQESRLHNFKLDAVRAFVKANRLDRIIIDHPKATIGIVTHGKSYLDVLQAFDDLELSEADIAGLGIRVYKVACTWPLEPDGLREFSKGLAHIIVVEEKRSLLETQAKEILYGVKNGPQIIGKKDENGKTLFQPEMALNSVQIAIAIGERIASRHGLIELKRRVELLKELQGRQFAPKAVVRSFYFCAGCPHNSSTVLPEGSKGYAGIGCSWMAQVMDRNTLGYTQMGGEGMAWVGEQPFSHRKHMFQNLGDGTYFHSGLLAIRAAVAARTNITYKILFNDAVAMTGGQRHDGPLTVPTITQQVYAEGVQRVVVVTDEPEKYAANTAWAPGVTVHHRSELQTVQQQLRDITGVTVLVYDQTCAAEKRRRRKKKEFPDPPKRLIINDLVCEGCGDCGAESNCVALVPLETEFGRKRAIDQSACNKDYSCLKGFCPSFITVTGGVLRKGATLADELKLAPVPPEPVHPSLDQVYSVIVTGVGGTGVVTIGAVLGMASHIEGKGCGILDMAGLAQKGGSVWSHLRFAASPSGIKAIRIATGGADLVLACDMVVGAHSKTLAATRLGKTRMVVNTHEVMTGDFARSPDLKYPSTELRAAIDGAVGNDTVSYVDATNIATTIFGDSIAANMFMLGYAYQSGLIPVSASSINSAIELNGAAVRMNQEAFLWGRRMAHDRDSVQRLLSQGNRRSSSERVSRTLDEMLVRRVAYLEQYQDKRYAQRYATKVRQVQDWEIRHFGGRTSIAESVARYLFKLMAYKDEYEVARLHSDPAMHEKLAAQFEGDFRISYNLAPPLLSRLNPETGRPVKKEYGPWLTVGFRLLAKLKFLRGSALDPFGRSAERRIERMLIDRYIETIDFIMSKTTEKRYQRALQLARIPEEIRGFGHVKERHVKQALPKWNTLQNSFESPEVIEIRRVA